MANEDKATRYHRLQRRASILATILTTFVLFTLVASGGSAGIRRIVNDWVGSSLVPIVIGYVIALGVLLDFGRCLKWKMG